MITLDDIRTETGIDSITAPMNKGVLLDPWMFDAMCSDDFSRKNGGVYDFNVHLDDYGIDLQRPYVWALFQQKAFIMSVLLEKPIDCFVVVMHRRADGNDTVNVIDGKQRLLTIHKFLHNEFPITVGGKEVYWRDFDGGLRRFFRSRVNSFEANVYYSDETEPISDRDKIVLFNYYNFSGTPQTDEHKNKLQSLIREE